MRFGGGVPVGMVVSEVMFLFVEQVARLAPGGTVARVAGNVLDVAEAGIVLMVGSGYGAV